MLPKELEHSLIAPLILLNNPRILKIGPSGHPSVDLIVEGLDVVVDLEVVGELLDVGGVLILGGEDGDGNADVGGVLGVEEGGVAGHAGLEGGVGVGSDEGYDFAAPAVLHIQIVSVRERKLEAGKGEGRRDLRR